MNSQDVPKSARGARPKCGNVPHRVFNLTIREMTAFARTGFGESKKLKRAFAETFARNGDQILRP